MFTLPGNRTADGAWKGKSFSRYWFGLVSVPGGSRRITVHWSHLCLWKKEKKSLEQEEQVREQPRTEEDIDSWIKGGKEASQINTPCSTIGTSALLFSQLPVMRGTFTLSWLCAGRTLNSFWHAASLCSLLLSAFWSTDSLQVHRSPHTANLKLFSMHHRIHTVLSPLLSFCFFARLSL